MHIVIITPTYNEVENINNFITKVFGEVAKISQHEFHLLIVDANSPDGTVKSVKKLQERYKNLHLLVEEKKKGLGGAYIQAIPYVLERFSPEVVMEMDADLSHDPGDIKRLMAEIENGHDFVIGSRQILGGFIPDDWSFYRKFLSVIGNLISRFLTGIISVHDHTAGFRAIRVKGLLEKIDVASFARHKCISRSYAFQIKLLYEAVRLGAKVKEVPVNFVDRTKGRSKMQINTIFDSLLLLIYIRLEKSQKFLQVMVVGGIGFVVQTLSLLVMVEVFNFNKVFSTAASAELAIISNFLLNNFWTFKERTKKVIWPLRFSQFNLTSGGSVIIQATIMWLGIKMLGESLYLIYFAVGVLLGLIWNYIFYSRLIWRK